MAAGGQDRQKRSGITNAGSRKARFPGPGILEPEHMEAKRKKEREKKRKTGTKDKKVAKNTDLRGIKFLLTDLEA